MTHVTLYRRYHFESARILDHLPESHPCSHLHGNSFTLTLHVGGALDKEKGWLMDFGEMDKKVRPIIKMLDHRHLNDIEGLAKPTSEHIALWLWHKLKEVLPHLEKLTLQETHAQGITITA